jgi:hypothetical protein
MTDGRMVERAFLPVSKRQVEDIPVLREPIRERLADKNVCLTTFFRFLCL